MLAFPDVTKLMCTVVIAFALLQAPTASAQKSTLTAEQAKQKFESYAYTFPDSARYYLHHAIRLDRTKHDSVVAKHYNNLGLLHLMNSSRDSARYYYKKSIGLANEANRFGTMVNLGALYKKEREFKSAIHVLTKAIEGYKKLNNQKGLGLAYGELGSVYSVMQDRLEAIANLKQGIAITKKYKMSRPLAIQQQNLATIYYKTRNYKFAKELYEECLSQLKTTNDKLTYAIALANYGSTLSALGDTKKSAVVLNEAAILLQPFDNDHLKAIVHGGIAAIALKNNDLPLATKEYEKSYQLILSAKSPESLSVVSGYLGMLNSQGKYSDALDIINTMERTIDFSKANESEKLDFYRQASNTLLNTGQDARGVQALKDVIALKDTVSEIENNQQVKEVEAMYQADVHLQKAVHHNRELRSTAENLLFKYRYATIAVFALTALLIWLWTVMRSRHQMVSAELADLEQQRMRRDDELHDERSKARQSEHLMQMQQQQLLTESLRNVNFAEQLQVIIEEFRQQQDYRAADKIEKLSDQAHWKNFLEKFNIVNPHFIQKLSNEFPQLNQGELQFCALVKVNLSYKEIANILQITHQSVFTKKYRIKKKMAIDGDTDFLDMIRTV